jgi:hypothetical protein
MLAAKAADDEDGGVLAAFGDGTDPHADRPEDVDRPFDALRATSLWLLDGLLHTARREGDEALAGVLADARDAIDSLDAMPDQEVPMGDE